MVKRAVVSVRGIAMTTTAHFFRPKEIPERPSLSDCHVAANAGERFRCREALGDPACAVLAALPAFGAYPHRRHHNLASLKNRVLKGRKNRG